MKRPIGFFWHAHQSQIYAELIRLEKLGFVGYQVIEQHDRPDKKLYTITESGLQALRRWVGEPVGVAPERSELVLKAYAAWLAEPQQAINLFREQERYHAANLAQYEHILAELQQEHASIWEVDQPFFGDYATLLKGIGYEREYVSWCGWMADQFEHYLQRKIAREL